MAFNTFVYCQERIEISDQFYLAIIEIIYFQLYILIMLKAHKKNLIKDFVSVSGFLHVSHMCIFTRTELGPYMKVARLQRGPTLTFRIHNYTLARDVVSSLRRQFVFHQQFEHAPLVVLNSFNSEEKHLKLVASMFQNMFPTINLIKVSTYLQYFLINYIF